MLKKELKFFEKNRNEWLKYYEDKFALIRNETLINTFTTEEEAYNEGIKQFGLEPFLIKQIRKIDIIASMPALTCGLINARP